MKYITWPGREERKKAVREEKQEFNEITKSDVEWKWHKGRQDSIHIKRNNNIEPRK